MNLQKNPLKDYYDIVVIGGGLGGLTAANVLAKNGAKVLLAEQHFQLGGLATYFKRKSHIFDVALHGFPVGMKKTLRKYWSKEMADRIIQVKSVRFDNPQFSLETDFTETDFTRILIEKFGQTPENVHAFYKTLSEMNFYDDQSMDNESLFQHYFPNRNDIVRLLMEPITYANGSTLKEPAITYGIVFSNFMSKGVYTFLGGTDLMLKLMKQELLQNHVDLAISAKVEKIEIQNQKVTGVIVNGHPIKCKSVVSNGNLLKTIFEWSNPKHFSPEFVQQAKKVRLNTSSCQVYMGLRPGEKIDFIGDLLFTSNEPQYSPESLLKKGSTSRTYSVYYPEIRPDNPPDYTIVSSSNAYYHDWSNLSLVDYQKAKQELIEKTLDAVNKYVPNIRQKIDYVDASTPHTFERYTLHGNGSSFGTKFEGLDISMKLPTQIQGLHHVGSVGIIMSGWLGAANYGVIVANNVLKQF